MLAFSNAMRTRDGSRRMLGMTHLAISMVISVTFGFPPRKMHEAVVP